MPHKKWREIEFKDISPKAVARREANCKRVKEEGKLTTPSANQEETMPADDTNVKDE